MKANRLTFTLCVLILALLTWFFWPTSESPPPPSASSPAAPSATPSSTPPATPRTPPPAPVPAERSTLADLLNAPSKNIRDDLRIVSAILETFRTNFPRTGNPVGTNAEITAVLAGNNKLQLALIPADHSAINRSTGELLDRWGTPFFFHAESGSRMEVRSAGPDKKHHTADDEALIP
ncbi:MAG: hypothetical protein EXS40_08040 [Opitutaceae bacterium]|nr:hypothetical protein [Opitutaceae bacterium]